MTVAGARGGPLEQDAVWGTARHLLEPLRSRPDWSELNGGAAALSRRALDPEAPEPALAGDAMHAAVHGLVWLACNLAERAPTLLIVDDVHWADAASLRWLAQLARRLEELPLGVLCAVRTGEPPGAPEPLAELLAAAPEPPIRPRPLGPDAAQALVAARLPAADAAFAHACHAVTAGNPFLLGALLDHLVAEQIAPDAATAARLSAFGPDQIALGVERQLQRLPAGASPLARALAVLGPGAPLRHAARLARLDPRHAARAADGLRAAGLVHGDGPIALAHPLIAGALYAHLAPGERALWHADAARMLVRRARRPRASRAAPAAHRPRGGSGHRRRPARGRRQRHRPRRTGERRPLPPPRRRRAAARPGCRRRASGSSSGSRAPPTSSPTRPPCCAKPSSSPRRPPNAPRSRCAERAHSVSPAASTMHST